MSGSDRSELDKKYFIDGTVYNCPFCKRNNVPYRMTKVEYVDWTDTRQAFVCIVKCVSCDKTSFHLSNSSPTDGRTVQYSSNPPGYAYRLRDDFDFDQQIFYSHPASRFAVDERIQPRIIRDLIIEAIGCLDMNFLTGASACARKAIYELLQAQGAAGESYEEKIKSLKSKYPYSDPVVFDMLFHIQGATSDVVHEDSSSQWSAPAIRFVINTLLAALTELFVIPDERKKRADGMQILYARVNKKSLKNDGPPPPQEER